MNFQRRQILCRKINGSANEYDETSISNSTKVIKQINKIRNTIYSLEKSIDVSRCLEVEQWSRFRKIKTNNVRLLNSLKEVEQRNTTMLNLFRANATDGLPESLGSQVKQSWQQKYDALLNMNNKLRKEIHLKNITIKEKNYEIAVLQQKLLNVGEKLIEQTETI